MKLLFDATVFQQPLTGVAKSTLGLYQACLRQSPAPEIVALHQRALSCEFPSEITSVRRGAGLPGGVWRKTVLPMAALAARPDVLHFPWNGNVPALFSGPLAVTTLHDVLPLEIPGHFQDSKQERAYRTRVQSDIERSGLLVTVSEYSKRQICANFRVTREPLVLHHAPTLAPPANQGAAGIPAGYFLYVGGYDPRKGLEELLRVFLRLRREGSLQNRLLIAGSKHYFSENFKRLIEEGRAQGVLEELGYVSDEILAGLLAGAAALVYPSRYEGFGLPPLEAMALGCPVLTTRGTSLPEICGEAALYIDPASEPDFARGLMALAADADLRADLRAKGLQQAARFSWDASARKFLQEIEKLLR